MSDKVQTIMKEAEEIVRKAQEIKEKYSEEDRLVMEILQFGLVSTEEEWDVLLMYPEKMTYPLFQLISYKLCVTDCLSLLSTLMGRYEEFVKRATAETEAGEDEKDKEFLNAINKWAEENGEKTIGGSTLLTQWDDK